MKKLAINTGYTTNSSSRVVHIPKEKLEHPDVQALLEAYEVEDGYVGDNLWHREACETLAITEEQKREARDKLQNHGFSHEPSRMPTIDVNDEDKAVLIYGDEYNGIVQKILGIISERTLPGAEYN